MADNYYAEILERIHNAMDRQAWQKASELLKQELSMPYVPSDVLKELEKLKKEVDPYLIKERVNILLTPEEVGTYLRKDSDSAYQALNTLNRSNIRNYLDVIQEYLLDEAGDRMMVSLLLQLCQKQGIRTPLSYRDGKEIRTVVPDELRDVTDDEGLRRTWQQLTEMFENENPSFMKLCHQVLLQHAYQKYPQSLENEENLAYRVAAYVFRAYGDEEGLREFAERHDLTAEMIEELVI